MTSFYAALFLLLGVTNAFNESPCLKSGGNCQADSSHCANGNYVSGLCPTQAANVRCCVPTPAFNEAPCLKSGGNCQADSSHCANGNYVSGLCPTQAANVRCCVPTPAFNEAPCLKSGGNCQADSSHCTNGNYVSGLCPTQAANVRCCVPTPATLSCAGIKGTCKTYTSCNGISVTRLCPGSSANRCCVQSASFDVIDKHLNIEEGGLYLQGYIPTDGSGVTIATGVDLGQQSASGLATIRVPSAIIAKLSPYLGLKTRSQVHNAGLNENNLKLTLSEGLALDGAFKASLLLRIAHYSRNLSIRGKAVLASLTHWCGTAVRTSSDEKCYIHACPNYIGNAMKGGTGTDATLKAAVTSEKNCAVSAGKHSYVIGRLQGEANFI